MMPNGPIYMCILLLSLLSSVILPLAIVYDFPSPVSSHRMFCVLSVVVVVGWWSLPLYEFQLSRNDFSIFYPPFSSCIVMYYIVFHQPSTHLASYRS